jgi:hypothetical protein
MKAVCYMGKEKMGVEDVPDPKILNPRDAIVRITSTCILDPTCIFTTGYCQPWNRATSWATSSWAKSWRSVPGSILRN